MKKKITCYCLNCGQRWIITKEVWDYLSNLLKSSKNEWRKLAILDKMVKCCSAPNLLYKRATPKRYRRYNTTEEITLRTLRNIVKEKL